MRSPSFAFLIAITSVSACLVTPPIEAAGGGFQSAMIGNGTDSVASKLHYPPKERAANRQAAVVFNCEIRTDGKPSQIAIRCDPKLSRFGDAVDVALHAGRFEPAHVGGQAVDVAIGGTVL